MSGEKMRIDRQTDNSINQHPSVIIISFCSVRFQTRLFVYVLTSVPVLYMPFVLLLLAVVSNSSPKHCTLSLCSYRQFLATLYISYTFICSVCRIILKNLHEF